LIQSINEIASITDTIFNNERRFKLRERQQLALEYLEKQGKITNWEYVNLCNVGYRTAHRDLTNLIEKGIVEIRKMGRSTHYKLIQ